MAATSVGGGGVSVAFYGCQRNGTDVTGSENVSWTLDTSADSQDLTDTTLPCVGTLMTNCLGGTADSSTAGAVAAPGAD
jgi:hypothetical protein